MRLIKVQASNIEHTDALQTLAHHMQSPKLHPCARCGQTMGSLHMVQSIIAASLAIDRVDGLLFGESHRWILAIQSANSRALGIVADKKTKRACLGIRMMHSSHTTPRSLSLRIRRQISLDVHRRILSVLYDSLFPIPSALCPALCP